MIDRQFFRILSSIHWFRPLHSNCYHMTRVLRKRKVVSSKIESATIDNDPVVRSKYFKKPKIEETDEVKVEITENPVDIEWVKSLNNKEYFEWWAESTGNVPNRWEIPLDESIFTDDQPKYFKEIYLKLRRLRSKVTPPVDLVGGSSIPLTVGMSCGIPKDQIEPINYRLQVLIGVMLSSQTKDEVTAKGMFNIMKYCIDELNISQGMTLQGLRKIDEAKLDELIKSVGFHTRKAKYIKQTCELLVSRFDSDIPTNITDMLSLPGVGPKMAYLTLQKAWGKLEGICVDVHVDRLCKLFKWVNPDKCKTPNHTRQELEKWLPRPLWKEINSLLVGFGQMIDRPKLKLIDPEAPTYERGTLEHELRELMDNMKNYKIWVNYLIRNAKATLDAREQETSIVTVKTENGGLVTIKNEFDLKTESLPKHVFKKDGHFAKIEGS
ncbi:hypothetical protein KAFR_0K00690 [Kazachstania africana CBS 2517]|uniref:Endonuclease III homolog n=1 Tax=Kazachstania africana (strain ATCC 22294 / BCRC 22015 / CBS 2517 / CECT 1963 / NBRC 1671 / NRRL Y-8276) TaxID=1071382 RepID=H2B1C4_KAZAF|nr:hypothetical protein KAFR_0K00690 [Kazachstania africana CBS 2517]CCF60424.1 hypothetical protein KAFR_0K00690 [Kazachstania africana CBS 2517]